MTMKIAIHKHAIVTLYKSISWRVKENFVVQKIVPGKAIIQNNFIVVIYQYITTEKNFDSVYPQAVIT